MSLSETEYRYLGLEEEKEVNRAKQDPKAFKPIYERYYGKIYGFLYKRVNDAEIAADLCSQTFLNALINLKKYEFRGLSFSAWLYRIAVNLSMDYFRQYKKQRVLYIDPERTGDLFLEMVDRGDPEEETSLYELKLPMVFKALSSKELEMVELRFFEEMSFKEMAFVLNMTEGNARTKTHRIVKKMKKLIESNEDRAENIA